MMSTFANSGNTVLEDAASEWRVAYGYTQQGPLCPFTTPGVECAAVSLWATIDNDEG